MQNLAYRFRDTRSLGNPVTKYIESHSDDVTEVRVLRIVLSSTILTNPVAISPNSTPDIIIRLNRWSC